MTSHDTSSIATVIVAHTLKDVRVADGVNTMAELMPYTNRDSA
jgi:hypothetical protein